MSNKLNNSRAGFTLIEAIVAIGIIFVGLVGVLVLLNQSVRSIRVTKSRMVAAHLAQEAIEVVVAIRDSNWAASQGWRTNIPSTTQGIVDYSSTAVTTTANPANYCMSISGNIYTHGLPPCNTPFLRHVKIIDRTDTMSGTSTPFIEVRSIVSWTDTGTTRTITVVDYLYDWR